MADTEVRPTSTESLPTEQTGEPTLYNLLMARVLEVHTTFASEGDATAVARKLVEERLAACAQVVPGVTSIFHWEGMLRHDDEVLLILKTTEEAWPALRDRLAKLHPYDTPEIIALPVEHGSYDYLAWVRENSEQV